MLGLGLAALALAGGSQATPQPAGPPASALTVTVTTTASAAATAEPSVPSMTVAPPSGVTYTDPSVMAAKAKAAAGIPVTECSKPTFDIDGALFVACGTDMNESVRFGTFADSPEKEAPALESLTRTGWKVHAGQGWIVAAGNRQVTLDKLVAALTKP